jgi:hypothetical protein
MMRRLSPTLVLAVLFAAPASAGILFNRKPDKPDPAQRVSELIGVVKTDGDESKRIEAAEELRQYDPATFPDVVPALLDALQNDKKPGVRAEAGLTLSKLRPVTTQVGIALEQSVAKDASPRVRLQVRGALMQYRWSGYKGAPKDDMPTAKPKEPPAAQTKEPPLAPPSAKEPKPAPAQAPPAAPPLAPASNTANPPSPSTTAKPLPTGPAKPATPPVVEEQGPELIPPP